VCLGGPQPQRVQLESRVGRRGQGHARREVPLEVGERGGAQDALEDEVAGEERERHDLAVRQGGHLEAVAPVPPVEGGPDDAPHLLGHDLRPDLLREQTLREERVGGSPAGRERARQRLAFGLGEDPAPDAERPEPVGGQVGGGEDRDALVEEHEAFHLPALERQDARGLRHVEGGEELRHPRRREVALGRRGRAGRA